MKKTRDLIQIAEKKLLESPFDIAHDIHHHYSVWKNCYLIAGLEKLNPDMEKLEIAAWWHDYERGSNEHETLKNEMKNLGFNDDYIQDVINLINSHSYADKRSSTVEGKVLFDADKIEYINPDRFCWIGEGSLDGLLDSESAKLYGKALVDRINDVVETINYNSSKHLFLINLELYLKLLDEQKIRYKEFLEFVDRNILEEQLRKLKETTTPISD